MMHMYDDAGKCKAQTRDQQKLCKLGSIDVFDDYCPFMWPGSNCKLAGFVVGEGGKLEKDRRSAHK